MLGDMTIQRMDNVAIVVDDLDAAVAFFTELGMELEGKGQVEGLWADRTVGLDGVRSDIAMMRTPDGHSKLELTKYHTPAASGAEPENPPPNTLGLHRVMFAVDDIHDTVARLRAHGAEGEQRSAVLANQDHLHRLAPTKRGTYSGLALGCCQRRHIYESVVELGLYDASPFGNARLGGALKGARGHL